MRLAAAALALHAASLPFFAQTTNAPPATAAPAPPASSAIAESDIIARAQTTLNKYSALPPEATFRDLQEEMADVESKLPYLSTQTRQLLARNASLDVIVRLQKWTNAFAATIGIMPDSTGGWIQVLKKQHDDLAAQSDSISAEHKIWDETAEALKKDSSAPPQYARQVAAVQAKLDSVQAEIAKRQRLIRGLQERAAADASQVDTASTALKTAKAQALVRLLRANAPPVWSFKDSRALDTSSALTWSQQLRPLKIYAKAEPGRFVAHFVLLAVLLGAFWWLRGYARRLTKDEPGIAPAAGIFETPFSMALLLAIGAGSFIYHPIAPQLLSAALGAVALIPCVIILRRLIDRRLLPILYALVVFYFLEEFRSVAAFSPDGARAFLLGEILMAVCFLAWLLLTLKRGASSERFGETVETGARVAMGVLAAGWLAEVLGYALLANLICVTVQRAATLALALYAGLRILDALLFILVRLRPLSTLGMVRQHREELLRRTGRILVWTAALIWFVVVYDSLPWSSAWNRTIFGWFEKYDAQGHATLRVPGRILVALILGWGVFQFSRLLRFTLQTDIYPRFRLAAGIPYAISNLLHYVLLTIAFIAATSVLGVDMTKFTILVSALGVGVGFGLQNIINNFVSGLILLFERPVKIGDTILTGTDTGTVERIGIRASILRTPAGTEVIVPNGTLISSNVTNWTLSSRERIILIPLNVPRGTDTSHLTAILTEAAASHPKVLKHPAPQVVAQTLGVNLGLELRAWTSATDDWTNVRSQILLAVNGALGRENITLA